MKMFIGETIRKSLPSMLDLLRLLPNGACLVVNNSASCDEDGNLGLDALKSVVSFDVWDQTTVQFSYRSLLFFSSCRYVSSMEIITNCSIGS